MSPPTNSTPEQERHGLVVVGELLATISSRDPGRLRLGTTLSLDMAGAEANVAIAAARLGTAAMWLGRLADDELGQLMCRELRAQGVGTAGVVWDPEVNSSLLLKSARTADTTEVRYYRSTGPGSRLSPEDLDAEAIAAARMIHITGITPALGSKPAAAIDRVIELAGAAGVPVSFDVNYRAALWSPDEARPVLWRLAEQATLVFAGPEELEILGLGDVPEQLLASGVGEVVVKDGARGAAVHTASGTIQRAALPVTVVDPVGAGDAFVGAYLDAHLRSASPDAKLEQAILVAAIAVSTLGDWAGLPSRSELARFDPARDVHR